MTPASRPELERAHDLSSRRAIAVPEPVIYVRDDTAQLMGMSAKDVVHPDYHNQYVFLQGKQQLLDLNAIREEFKEKRRTDASRHKPVVSVAPDGETPVLLIVDDQTEPEEVQDLLGQQYEKNEAKVRKARKAHAPKGSPHQTEVIETDWIRHVNHMPQADQMGDLYKQALRDRMEKHRQNPVSDPARDPWKEAREKGLAPDEIKVSVPDNYNVGGAS